MSSAGIVDVEVELDKLRDFQRRTAEYAFRRMFEDDDCTTRFLVADEVGLGKTFVAKGVVAQVLDNALHAVEELDERAPTIKIDTARREDAIVITVIDNGRGIGAERRAQVFRPFYTSRDGAMGLGLTLAGELARRYEGAIKVNSLAGRGTVARITLPTGTPGP